MKKKLILSCILMLVFAVCLKIMPVFAWDFLIFEDNFEGSINWSADNGVWEIGIPTSGPGECHEGEQCAGTILDGNYPAYTDSRLIGPYISPWEQGIELPEIIANEELHLRFWNWFSYSSYDSGQVQISVQDDATGDWGAWVNEGGAVSSYSGGWSLKDVDLSDYAGQTLRIGFLHVADRKYGNASEGPGWFVDNIELVGPTQIMPTINTISFASYIPDPCTSFIDVFASAPCGGELTYTWQLPDGGTLVGTGANMEFIPPDIRIEPYRVRVAASSNATRISSFTKTLKIFTKVLYDLDGYDDIDGADLAEFLVNVEVNSTTISRFAKEFGMIACQ